MTDPDCVFCKIVRGEIPSKKIYDDAEVMAFHDIRPQAPVHILVIPKAHIANLYDAQPAHQAALGKMLTVAGRLARGAAGWGIRRCIMFICTAWAGPILWARCSRDTDRRRKWARSASGIG